MKIIFEGKNALLYLGGDKVLCFGNTDEEDVRAVVTVISNMIIASLAYCVYNDIETSEGYSIN